MVFKTAPEVKPFQPLEKFTAKERRERKKFQTLENMQRDLIMFRVTLSARSKR
jgi:hypothetical protein